MSDFFKYKGALQYLALSLKEEFKNEGQFVLLITIFLGSFVATLLIGEHDAEHTWKAAKEIIESIFTYFFTSLSFIIAGFALLLSSARRVFYDEANFSEETLQNKKDKKRNDQSEFSPTFSLILSFYYVFSIHLIGLIFSSVCYITSFFKFSPDLIVAEYIFNLSFSSLQFSLVCSIIVIFFVAAFSLLDFFYNMLTSSLAAAILEKIDKQVQLKN